MKLRVGKHVRKKYDGQGYPVVYTIGGWTSQGEVLLYYRDREGRQEESYSRIDLLIEADPYEESFFSILDRLNKAYSKAKSEGATSQENFIFVLEDMVNKLDSKEDT